MSFLSGFSLLGFALGAIAGALAMDLTRESVRIELFWPIRRFWRSPLHFRQQLLVIIFGLWCLILLIFWLFSDHSWEIVLGTIIGVAAAPWLWLHFLRDFDRDRIGQDADTDRRHIGAEQEAFIEAEIGNDEPPVAETPVAEPSYKHAELQLARYRLLSIVFGIALLAAALLPALKDWLPRTQQFSAFGVSLTLLERQAGNQGRGTQLINNLPDAESSGDRLLDATMEAYKIGAANLKAPLTSLQRVGATLDDFGNLSVIDKDRAFIA